MYTCTELLTTVYMCIWTFLEDTDSWRTQRPLQQFVANQGRMSGRSVTPDRKYQKSWPRKEETASAHNAGHLSIELYHEHSIERYFGNAKGVVASGPKKGLRTDRAPSPPSPRHRRRDHTIVADGLRGVKA
jgi:hypothetical protein